MFGWLTQFISFAQQLVSQGDAQTLTMVFLVAMLTEFFIPFPLVLDTFLFMLGFQITSLWPVAIAVVLVAMAGRVLGATGVYWLSRSLGQVFINWIGKQYPSVPRYLDTIGRKTRLKGALLVIISRLGIKTTLALSATSLGATAPLSVALARMTPGLLTVTSIASGTLGFRYKYFAFGIAIASILGDAASITLGVITGYGLRGLDISPSSWLMFVAVVIDIAILIVIQRFAFRRRARRMVREPAKDPVQV